MHHSKFFRSDLSEISKLGNSKAVKTLPRASRFSRVMLAVTKADQCNVASGFFCTHVFLLISSKALAVACVFQHNKTKSNNPVQT